MPSWSTHNLLLHDILLHLCSSKMHSFPPGQNMYTRGLSLVCLTCMTLFRCLSRNALNTHCCVDDIKEYAYIFSLCPEEVIQRHICLVDTVSWIEKNVIMISLYRNHLLLLCTNLFWFFRLPGARKKTDQCCWRVFPALHLLTNLLGLKVGFLDLLTLMFYAGSLFLCVMAATGNKTPFGLVQHVPWKQVVHSYFNKFRML